MKNCLLIIKRMILFTVGLSSYAQDSTVNSDIDVSQAVDNKEVVNDGKFKDNGSIDGGSQLLKKYFIDGGDFMFPILLCFIFGLAVIIEKIISLNLKSVNSKKLLEKIEILFKNGKAEEAEDLCRNTRGIVASISYQAILRRTEGVEGVEKSIISYGSVQMSLLEKGLVWISLFISVAPMLGFLGTVIGMVEAFDSIEQAGIISPSLLAGGIKVALITTVGGLIVAIILQVFYNYLISKIDNLVMDMEDSAISLVDMMIEYGITKKNDLKA